MKEKKKFDRLEANSLPLFDTTYNAQRNQSRFPLSPYSVPARVQISRRSCCGWDRLVHPPRSELRETDDDLTLTSLSRLTFLPTEKDCDYQLDRTIRWVNRTIDDRDIHEDSGDLFSEISASIEERAIRFILLIEWFMTNFRYVNMLMVIR